MNPLSLINSFNFLAEERKLDAETQMIYFKLWHLWNKYRRPEKIFIDNKKLMSLTRIKSECVLIRKRKILLGLDLIKFESGKKGIVSAYSLVNDSKNDSESVSESVSESDSKNDSANYSEKYSKKLNSNKALHDIDTKSDSKKYSKSDSKNDSESVSESVSESDRLNKSIKSIRDIENNKYIFLKNARGIVAWYNDNVNTQISQSAMQVFGECVELYSEADTLQALQEAVKSVELKDVALAKYTRGILKNWKIYGKGAKKNEPRNTGNRLEESSYIHIPKGEIDWTEFD